jgi:hypothetical protein
MARGLSPISNRNGVCAISRNRSTFIVANLLIQVRLPIVSCALKSHVAALRSALMDSEDMESEQVLGRETKDSPPLKRKLPSLDCQRNG